MDNTSQTVKLVAAATLAALGGYILYRTTYSDEKTEENPKVEEV